MTQTVIDLDRNDQHQAASIVVANCLLLAARLHVGYSGRPPINDEAIVAILRDMIAYERSQVLPQ